MKIIRPITPEDLRGFKEIADATGIGMTSIPKDLGSLEKIIAQSQVSFAKTKNIPSNETYIFVLEDMETKKLGGVCGIYSKTGVKEPVFFYHLKKHLSPASSLPLAKEQLALHPEKSRNGPSELCSLFLLPEFRKEGLGKLLSLSRFLFLKAFTKRFDPHIYAELRGFINQNHQSPFWNAIGRHFLDLSFLDLNKLLNGKRNYFAEALPKFPIYASLLPEQAQKAIQKTHTNTKNALTMLLEEGFKLTDRINPIDGGPIVEAPIKQLKRIQECQVAKLKKITEKPLATKVYLVSNKKLDFRCSFAKVKSFASGEVALEKNVANALNLEVGDTILYSR